MSHKCTSIQLSSNVITMHVWRWDAHVMSTLSLSECKVRYYANYVFSTVKISNVIGNEMRQANVMTKLWFVYTFLVLTRILNTRELRAFSVNTWGGHGGSLSFQRVRRKLYYLRSEQVLQFCQYVRTTWKIAHIRMKMINEEYWEIRLFHRWPRWSLLAFETKCNPMICFFFSTLFWTAFGPLMLRWNSRTSSTGRWLCLFIACKINFMQSKIWHRAPVFLYHFIIDISYERRPNNTCDRGEFH